MKKIPIAMDVSDIETSARDYSQRLGCQPDLLIPDLYALWRPEAVLFPRSQLAPGLGPRSVMPPCLTGIHHFALWGHCLEK